MGTPSDPRLGDERGIHPLPGGGPATDPRAQGIAEREERGGGLGRADEPGEWSRARLKAECLRAVARTPDNEALKYLATNTIETYLPLDEDEEAEYRSVVKEDDYMEAWEVE